MKDLKELLEDAHNKGATFASNLETGYYAEDFDEYYRHHKLNLNEFELRKVGGSLPTKEEIASELENHQSKVEKVHHKIVSEAYALGFRHCYHFISDWIKVKR